ncbi:hypothetical protein Y032_0147g2584 [Ancylostoma ceylanicum]|uniref:BAG domain-containing protein n=1 Tax=Ancylostoma ceylanicum TaxID=53326 RepID=A0A016T289_9BILA|nr:hypothetical protein Y032_0147g2584 [Ancylostoma ceylanicum]
MAARIIPITIQRSNEASSTASEKSASPPAPPSTASSTEMAANSRAAPISLVRNRSIEDFNEQVVNMLDDVEKRVEQLRESASNLEAEKEQILDMLNSVSLNTELLRLGQGDREDINAITNRLAARTKTVDVTVNTPRSAEQERALSSVNHLIDGVVEKLQEDMQAGKDVGSLLETCRRYLNACNPEQPDGPIDQRFQAQLIECTADDQKKIRRKLAQLITQLERAERTFTPQW